ncbi:MAG: hypothetical protein ABFR47_07945 [Verrucomicrobiota bacterium]
MKKNLSIPIVAVSIGIALGGIVFGMKASNRCKAAEEESNRLRLTIAQMQTTAPATKKHTPPTPVPETPANTNAVAKLEAELVSLHTELAAAKETQRPQREGWEERMARIKKEDPEGYADMIKSRTERRQAMRYDLAERMANFLELDTGFMTDSERENHEMLVGKMADVWALTEQLQNRDPEQPPDRETMRELFGTINEARPLMDEERSTMFRQLANDLGFDGEEAQVFSGYVEDIISATTIQRPRGMGPGRRSGP